MKQALLLYLSGLLILFNLASCGKDAPAPDREKLLVANAWKANKITAESEDDEAVEMASVYTILFSDFGIHFYEDGTYEDSYLNKSTWKLSEDNSMILLKPNTAYQKSWQITELTANSLEVTWTAHFLDIEQKVHAATIRMYMIPAD